MHNCTIIKSRNENSRQSSNRKTVPHKTGYQWLKNKKFYKPQYFYNQTKIFQQSSFRMLFQLWRNSAMVHKSQPRGKRGVISACYCAETVSYWLHLVPGSPHIQDWSTAQCNSTLVKYVGFFSVGTGVIPIPICVYFGGNVTSAGWQVTLCDHIWYVCSRRFESSC